MNDQAVKTCVSCKHFNGPDAEPYVQQYPVRQEPLCEHPSATTRDPIYGKALARAERADTNKKGCGRQGKLWEPRR